MNPGAQIFSGVKWTSLSMVVVTVCQLAAMMVLARFLDPKDFGLMAIMMVVIGFAQAFADMGISNAIIQRRDITHEQLSSLYWLNLASGFVLSVIVAAISPLIAAFYGRPELTELIRVLSIVFVIVAAGNQYRVLCQKEMQFEYMARIEILAAFSSLIVSVALAVSGFGIYALVWGMLAQAGVSSLCFVISGLRYHRPALLYRHRDLKGFFSFGLYQMGEKSINYISANVDNLIIGKMLGMEALGFYNLAWQLCMFPVQKLNPVVGRIAFPLYSKLQNDRQALAKHYADFLHVIFLISVPALIFLFYFAGDVVRVLYGAGWEKTAMLVPFLALVGVCKAAGNPGGSLFLALGRADIGFWWNLVWTAFVSAGLVGAMWFYPHLEGMAWALLFLMILTSIVWHIMVARIGGVAYGGIVKDFIKIFSVAMIAGGVAAQIVQIAGFTSALVQVMTAGILCGAFYGLYLFAFEKPLLKSVFTRQG